MIQNFNKHKNAFYNKKMNVKKKKKILYNTRPIGQLYEKTNSVKIDLLIVIH